MKTGKYYVVEQKQEDVKQFALFILKLTNVRSNNLGVLDFKTSDGTNKIEIFAEHDISQDIENFFEIVQEKDLFYFKDEELEVERVYELINKSECGEIEEEVYVSPIFTD